MKIVLLAITACLALGISLPVCSEDAWLQGASMLDRDGPWKMLPTASYLDLGNDPDAVAKLADDLALLDPGTSGKSLSLQCTPPSKRYLIRSLHFSDSGVMVYENGSGLIIGAGSFSEPRSPSRGAVAICLAHAPSNVRSTVGFAK